MLKDQSDGVNSICSDGHCVDGYCCNTACTNSDSCYNGNLTVYSCSVAGHLGTCSSSTGICPLGTFCANSTSCKTSCSKNSDCVYGSEGICLNGVCMENGMKGELCSNVSQCHPMGGTYPTFTCSNTPNDSAKKCRIAIGGGANQNPEFGGCTNDNDCVWTGNQKCINGYCSAY